MKSPILLITLLINFLIIGCTQAKIKTPELPNSIELSAIKMKDTINSSFRMNISSFKEDNPRNYIYPKIKGIPDSLRNINIYYCCLDNMQAHYQAYKAGLIKKDDFILEINKEINDTIYCVSRYVKTFVTIVTGISKIGIKYYLIDANNNYDLGDERLLIMREKISSDQPHKVLYERAINDQIQLDSTWIGFYEDKEYDVLWMQFCEHTLTSFTFDSVPYNLTTYPSQGTSVKYGKEVIYKVKDDFNDEMQIFGYNQYARLSDLYYQVSCRDDGRTIKLQLDTAAWGKGSTQLNMPALPFKAITLKGDTVRFPSDFKGKYVLLDFWSTHCPHCIEDIKNSYLHIYKKYGGEKFEIVGVADDSKSATERFVSQNKITWTMIPAKKSFIQDIYRIDAYPVLFLINPNGIIISKGQELRRDKINTVLEKYLEPNSLQAN